MSNQLFTANDSEPVRVHGLTQFEGLFAQIEKQQPKAKATTTKPAYRIVIDSSRDLEHFIARVNQIQGLPMSTPDDAVASAMTAHLRHHARRLPFSIQGTLAAERKRRAARK